MIEVRLPDSQKHRLPFYLAMEEWVACNLPAAEYLFLWRVEPTVICGRNQDIYSEVNIEYCKANNIDVVRRRSGGGCVYADMNNYMFSYIAPGDNVDSNYSRYTTFCSDFLSSLGFDVEVSGRNDLLVSGSKVSGCAFYHLKNRSIIHGTMLYDYNPERMAKAITPSVGKLISKGVHSVPNRITSLKEQGASFSLKEFGSLALRYLCTDDPVLLSSVDVKAIEELEQEYYRPEFLYGKNKKRMSSLRYKRIEGAGDFNIGMEVSPDGLIENVELSGDFFSSSDINVFLKSLSGLPYEQEAIRKVVSNPQFKGLLRNVSDEQLLEILI